MVLVSYPLIAPLFVASTASGLPACCLRNGKHHCALATGDANPSLRARQAKCPLFPKAEAVPVFSKIAVFSVAPAASAPQLSGAAIARPDGRVVPIILRDSVRKRGPPAP
jgi:hypothetical protein